MDQKIPYCCGSKMQRQIQAVYGYMQAETHYICPKTRQPITTRKQRLESFAKHNLIDASDWDPAKEIAKQQKRKADNAALASCTPHVADLPQFGEKVSHG